MTGGDDPLPWRLLVLPFVAVVGLLLIVGERRGGPLLSSTALVALPIAFALCAGLFAYIRHRERADPGRAEHRVRSFYRLMLAFVLTTSAVDAVRDPSWVNLLIVLAFSAAAYAEWRSRRAEGRRAPAH